ncbi:MAG: 1-phosphofructokinase [Clostridia bacterium]
MIYTVTFSPALDYVIDLDELRLGETNRSQKESYYFGGKGINVSTVLTNLGIENTALGFVSGFTGSALERGLKDAGLKTDFIHLEEGITRINIKLRMKQETEINTQGAAITESKLEALLGQLERLKEDDTLVISGNIPNTLPDNIYEIMLKRLGGRGIRFVVDATGMLLKNVLKYRPFLIKPNRSELEELTESKIQNDADLEVGAKKLQDLGARNVLVSLGGDGAYLLCENGKQFRVPAIREAVKNTVGAGDSMVAGFLAGYMRKKDYEYALKLGIAAGSATACSEGLAKREKIEEFFQKI